MQDVVMQCYTALLKAVAYAGSADAARECAAAVYALLPPASDVVIPFWKEALVRVLYVPHFHPLCNFVTFCACTRLWVLKRYCTTLRGVLGAGKLPASTSVFKIIIHTRMRKSSFTFFLILTVSQAERCHVPLVSAAQLQRTAAGAG